MDLFDPPEVAQNATINPEKTADSERFNLSDDRAPSEWDCLEWEPDQPDPPTDAELEARFCGQERAGCPAWSASAQRLRAHWRAFLESQPESERAVLQRIEDAEYRAARIRKLARLAKEAGELPE